MAVNGLSALNNQQFLRLFITQLQNQNPLEPLSDKDLTTQLAQFSTLQGIEQLNASFADMLQLQQLTQGSELLGRTVSFRVSGSNQPARGVVSAVNVNNGSVQLRIGNQDVLLSNVLSVERTPT